MMEPFELRAVALILRLLIVIMLGKRDQNLGQEANDMINLLEARARALS